MSQPGRKPAPPRDYRTTGAAGVDPWCLLDVMAAAGAALVTSRRFALRRAGSEAETLPEITPDQAAALIREIAGTSWRSHNYGPMDFLRAAGQMPDLAGRAREIAETVTPDEIVAWRELRARPNVSLRVETHHESDRPAALRWQGSAPIPRHSHPGRNALALLVIARTLPSLWQDQQEWKFSRPRVWFAPHSPISGRSWLILMASGPTQSGTWLDPDVGTWFQAGPTQNGKAVALGIPRYWEAP